MSVLVHEEEKTETRLSMTNSSTWRINISKVHQSSWANVQLTNTESLEQRKMIAGFNFDYIQQNVAGDFVCILLIISSPEWQEQGKRCLCLLWPRKRGWPISEKRPELEIALISFRSQRITDMYGWQVHHHVQFLCRAVFRVITIFHWQAQTGQLETTHEPWFRGLFCLNKDFLPSMCTYQLACLPLASNLDGLKGFLAALLFCGKKGD